MPVCRSDCIMHVTVMILSRYLTYMYIYTGIGDPKYLAVPSWESLKKTLEEALEAYNEINAIMNLVLFADAMNHM